MGPFGNVGTQARRLPNLPHSKCKDCKCGFSDLLSRVEIVEGVSDFCGPLGIGSIQEAGARAIKAGPVWRELRAGVKEESQVASRFLLLAPGWRVSSSRAYFM